MMFILQAVVMKLVVQPVFWSLVLTVFSDGVSLRVALDIVNYVSVYC